MFFLHLSFLLSLELIALALGVLLTMQISIHQDKASAFCRYLTNIITGLAAIILLMTFLMIGYVVINHRLQQTAIVNSDNMMLQKMRIVEMQSAVKMPQDLKQSAQADATNNAQDTQQNAKAKASSAKASKSISSPIK